MAAFVRYVSGGRRDSSAPAARATPHEGTPLVPRNQALTGQLAHTGSVYTYMLFTPPLSRQEKGHYWTWNVALAFSLMVLSVTLQVSLTVIAGNDILAQQKLARDSLIRDAHESDEAYLALIEADIGKLAERGLAIRDKITDPIHKAMELAKKHREKKEAVDTGNLKCCAEAACFGFAVSCCAHSGDELREQASSSGLVAQRDHDAWVTSRPPNFTDWLSFVDVSIERKPGGGGKSSSGRTHTSKDGGKEAESEAGDDDELAPTIDPLCTDANGVLICMPPSFGILEDWEDLDTDGDGVWTLQEAHEDAANLGCQTGTILEDLFRAACRGLIQATDKGGEGLSRSQLPQSLRARQGIPRSYFELWRGFFAVCIHAHPLMCGSLITDGVFDGALDPASHEDGLNWTKPFGGVRDLDSAMGYCQRLLTPGGICDAALPGRYVIYRHRLADTCGAPVLTPGPRHTNPHDSHDAMGFMMVSWTSLNDFQNTYGLSFKFFMFLILAVWYVNMVNELKDIINLWDFIANFPVLESWPFSKRPGFTPIQGTPIQSTSIEGTPQRADSDSEERDAEKDSETGEVMTSQKTYIASVSRPHKYVVVSMAIVRSIVFWYLAFAGTVFLLSNHSFVDLLLNALAMAFLFELDEFLYFFLVPDHYKEKLDELQPLRFSSSLPSPDSMAGAVFGKHMWGLILIPSICLCVLYGNDQIRTIPMLKALKCACMKEGETCLATALFTTEWWNQYWRDLAQWRLKESDVWYFER